jgi:hypothetical protein
LFREGAVDQAQTSKRNHRRKSVRMRVKQKNCCENEKRTVARGFHFEESPEKPADEKHVEGAIAALSTVQQKLNRQREKRRGGERG